jgi:ribonuclease HI
MSTHHFTTYTDSELDTLQNIAILTDSKVVMDRWNFRFNFLEKLIKNKRAKVLVWDVKDAFEIYDTIQDATNNKIDDGHWSYKGHKDFANYILNRLSKPYIAEETMNC